MRRWAESRKMEALKVFAGLAVPRTLPSIFSGIVCAAAVAIAVAGCAARRPHVVSSGVAPSPQRRLVPPPRPLAKPQKKSPAPALLKLMAATTESEKGERAYRNEYYKSAARHFRKALELTPGYLHSLSGLGWTLYDSGRPGEAFPIFQDAHNRHPRDRGVRRGLAYLYFRYGRTEKARALLGSLDRERWPELANIEDELREMKLKGAPLPRPPGEKRKKPENGEEKISDRLFGFLKEKSPAEREKEDRVPETLMEALKEPVPEKPEKEKRPLPKKKKELLLSLGKGKFIRAQPPSFHTMVDVPGGLLPVVRQTAKRIAPFRIDKLEVTNALYAAFVRKAGAAKPPFWKWARFVGPHLPVVGVTWNEARAYCRWAGKRLPAEEEWEFAAGQGDKDRNYPWGKKFVGRHAVFGLRPDRGGPKAVGRRPGGASPYGVEDMSGNVWEWVESPFRRRENGAKLVSRGGVVYRTLRGGSWVNGRGAMRISSRTGALPGRRLPVYGFRCAADSP